MTEEERFYTEADFVKREGANKHTIAIYSELVNVHWPGDPRLVTQSLSYSIITDHASIGRTPEELIEDCRDRHARPLFMRF